MFIHWIVWIRFTKIHYKYACDFINGQNFVHVHFCALLTESVFKAICKLPKSTPNVTTQLPYKLFGMNAFSFKNAYLKCIGEQLRDALNDQGWLGIIYKGLTKFIMAKYGGSTILTTITIAACLHSPITRTKVLLIENGIQIRSFDQTFHTTSTSIEKEWTNRQHMLTPLQQANTQKYNTNYIHSMT
jgi:hypothetical protein